MVGRALCSRLLILVVVLLDSLGQVHTEKNESVYDQIHVVYTVDVTSISQFALSVSSLNDYGGNYASINVHTVVCASTEASADTLIQNIINTIAPCFTSLRFWQYTMLNQDKSDHNRADLKSPHWYGSTELVRNHIPVIIPKLDRYIYFDNDVILTKHGILEKLWTYNLSGRALGIVGNVLHNVEAKRYLLPAFNMQSISLQKLFNYQGDPSSFTLNHILKEMPSFPNNGVMIVDAVEWLKLGLNKLVSEVENVIKTEMPTRPVGSQPVAMLALHRHWTLLPQIFNLRMAGSGKAHHAYMMRMGVGILHFAGAQKPNQMCNVTLRTFKTPLPERMIMLHHFADQCKRMVNQCPSSPYTCPYLCSQIDSTFADLCDANPHVYRNTPWAVLFSQKCDNGVGSLYHMYMKNYTAFVNKMKFTCTVPDCLF